MTLAVWKFPLEMGDRIEIDMPGDAQLLRVATQIIPPTYSARSGHGRLEQPCLWALVHPDRPTTTRRFRIAGTGHTLDPEGVFAPGEYLDYVGSFSLAGPLEFHIFEIKAELF